MSVRNIGASIRDRLLNKARTRNLDYNMVLTRYALERMLYRMSISEQRDQFLLKGALLFDLWFDVPHRPTHDADFLGFGSAEIPHIVQVFQGICSIEIEDGIVFQPNSVKATKIRKEANYAGIRVTLLGRCWAVLAAQCKSISVLVMPSYPTRMRSTIRSSSARCPSLGYGPTPATP